MPRRSVPLEPFSRYGRLIVIRPAEPYVHPNGDKYSRSLCRCDCGNLSTPVNAKLRAGDVKSCGCIVGQYHGMAGTPEYKAWLHIKDRCFSPLDISYHNYGARGITMFEGWINDFKSFYDHIGPRPSPKHSVDRINNNSNYEPDNVRWATRKEQSRNKRNNRLITYNGETHCLKDWAGILGINRGTLESRLHRSKWPVEKAFTFPIDISKRNLSK